MQVPLRRAAANQTVGVGRGRFGGRVGVVDARKEGAGLRGAKRGARLGHLTGAAVRPGELSFRGANGKIWRQDLLPEQFFRLPNDPAARPFLEMQDDFLVFEEPQEGHAIVAVEDDLASFRQKTFEESLS